MSNRSLLHPARLTPFLLLSIGLLILFTGRHVTDRNAQAATEQQKRPNLVQLTPTLPPFSGGNLLFAPIIQVLPAPPEPTCLTADTEPNDISANATLPICFNTDLPGTVSGSADQTDIYRLVLDFSGDLTIEFDNLSSEASVIVMTLFGSNGELIQHDGSNAQSKRFLIENGAAGIYFLTISDASESPAPQPYNLRFLIRYDVTPTPPANQTETPVPINSTATSTATIMPTEEATGQPTATDTPQANPTTTPITFPSLTPAAGTATHTPQPVATETAQPNPTATPQPTQTATPVPNATATSQPAATNTPQPISTATNTPQPQPTATNTSQPAPTHTAVPSATPTATHTPLPTATPTATATLTPSPTATPTTAPNNSPNTPSSPFPSNGETVSDTSPLLTWSGGDPDGDSVTYDVFFQFQFGSEQLLCNDVTIRRCATGTLTNGFDYSWRVVATDSKGASTSGPTWTFFVNDGGPLP